MNYGSLIDKNKLDKLDSADAALYKWTADGFTDISVDQFNKLKKRYPFDGGTLYRGLHFDSDEQFAKFMESLNDGIVELHDKSSWTVDKDTAYEFSTSKKSYFPDAMMHSNYSKTQKAGDYMSGAGVMIKTKVGKDIGINVTESPFAKESEVLLPSGKYKIEVEKVYLPLRKTHNSKEQIAGLIDFISTSTLDNSEAKRYADYIYASHVEKLNEEQADILLKFFLPKMFSLPIAQIGEKAADVEIRDMKFNNELEVRISAIGMPDDRILDLASAKTKKRFDDIGKAAVKNLKLKLTDKLPDIKKAIFEDQKKVSFNVSGIDGLRQYGVDAALKPLKTLLGDAYKHYNSREFNRTLKTSEAISKHAKFIANLVSAMSI